VPFRYLSNNKVHERGHWVVAYEKSGQSYLIRDPGYTAQAKPDIAISVASNGSEVVTYCQPNRPCTDQTLVPSDLRVLSPTPGYQPAVQIVAHSPIELLISDPAGRRTGRDSAGNRLSEIPDSDYYVEDPIAPISVERATVEALKVLQVPLAMNGPYALVIIGTGDGPYQIDFDSMDELGNLSKRQIYGLAITGSQAVINLTYNGANLSVPVPLQGDLNLDGRVDQADVDLMLRLPIPGVVSPHDPRDLNGDGKIDSLDVARLTVVCGSVCNRPPVANAGMNRIVEAISPTGASVSLDGSASSDPDGDALAFTWSGLFGMATGPKPTVTLPLGANSIALTVSDGRGGTATATATVQIVDTTPPTVTYSGNAGTYTIDQAVRITCSATDSGSGITSTSCKNVTGEAYSFALGVNALSATATDAAGNAGSGSTSFSVKVTTASPLWTRS
jgi:Dockerin type I domain